MKVKTASVLMAVAGVGLLAVLAAPPIFGRFDSRVLAQGRYVDGPARRSLTVLAGRGAEIGVSIRDLESADKGSGPGAGVVVEEVHSNSPAEKAGLKAADIIVEFDGEHVRSARQFTRIVQETAPGRMVKAAVVRDGQRRELQITPGEGRDDWMHLGEPFVDQLGAFGQLSDRFNLDAFNDPNFHFAFPQLEGRRRLGVAVDELTPQLATYFGAKNGVLVASITEDSPASRAGLKAGDVITKLNDESVRSRDDLLRLLREAKDGDVTIGIVRDHKESNITATLESRRPARVGRPAVRM